MRQGFKVISGPSSTEVDRSDGRKENQCKVFHQVTTVVKLALIPSGLTLGGPVEGVPRIIPPEGQES